MKLLLILLFSIIGLNKALEYSSTEYQVTFNTCPGQTFNLQDNTCVNVDIASCFNNKYLTVENNGSLYLKIYNESECTSESSISNTIKFDCSSRTGSNFNGVFITCQSSDMGNYYWLSSDSCSGLQGEQNHCVSFNGEQKCGYRSIRFNGNNGDNPTFFGYNNTYCGNNNNGDVISQFSVSCIKSSESKAYNLKCSDSESSGSNLIFNSTLLLLLVLFLIL